MAMEQYFQEAVARNDFSREDVASSPEKWKTALVVDGSENCQSGGFDCNICLDFVQDPVVTLCGHLYCWPCIYKWIHFQSASTEYAEQQQQPQCPVCKAEVSQKTLVPLYGRGKTTKPSEGKAPHLGIVVPRRPPSPTCGVRTLIATTTSPTSHSAQQLNHRSHPQQSQPYYSHPGNYASTPVLAAGGTTTTNVFSPMIGMFGEMVFARIFGNSEATLYGYPNSYNLTGSTSPRMRRQAMQAEKSLSRICFFICCCMVLCLLLF